jgi:hypothetical protein
MNVNKDNPTIKNGTTYKSYQCQKETYKSVNINERTRY